MNWRYENPVQLVFGKGSLAKLPQLVPWESILVVTTPGAVKRRTINRVLDLLSDRDIDVYDMVTPGPQLAAMEKASVQLKQRPYEGIVAFGGGSAIDTAKAFSYLLNSPVESLRRHFEYGEPLKETPLSPVLAIQTAAGTGSEVTPFATIWDTVQKRKYSIGPPDIYPQTALLDPELTLTLPRDLTLSASLDALCQGLESLWSRRANPVSSALALRSVSITLEVLPNLVDDLNNIQLRTQILEASLLAGLAIASTRTTLSHSISYPITLHFEVPHGLACAFSIVQVLRFNAQQDQGPIRAMLESLGFGSVDSFAYRLEEILFNTGAFAQLAELIPSKTRLLELASEAFTPDRADNNPRHATTEDVEAIMSAAWNQALQGAKLSST